MHSLNALLRLSHYLENNQTFLSNDILFEHIEAAQRNLQLATQDIHNRGGIALGWRLVFAST